MDPTARMLLEVAYEALENAGLPIENLVGSDTSCYVGCFTRDYHEMLMRDAETAPMVRIGLLLHSLLQIPLLELCPVPVMCQLRSTFIVSSISNDTQTLC